MNPRAVLRDQINRLISTFGQTAFSAERIKAIDGIIGDLPDDAIREIATNMIENLRQAPLPKDFRDAKLEWFRRRTVIDVQKGVDRCPDCFDTGYLCCQLHSSEPETLAFCYCIWGEEAESLDQSIMPRWKERVFDRVYGFKLLPFPKQRFKPPTKEEQIKAIQGGLVEAMDWWKNQKRGAHEYWARRVEEERAKTGVGNK